LTKRSQERRNEVTVPAPSADGISISVMIPCFNHEKYIAESIESVLEQQRQPCEIVVIDDASTDQSASVVQAYCQRFPTIRFQRNARNKGALRTVNDALPFLRGTHCLLLASDDKILPGYLEAAHEALNRHPDVGMFLSHIVLFKDGEPPFLPEQFNDRARLIPSAEAGGFLRGKYPHGMSVYNLALLRKEGGFDERLRWHADWWLNWVVCFRYGLCYSPRVFGAVRVVKGSFSSIKPAVEYGQVVDIIVDRLCAPENRALRSQFKQANALVTLGPRFARVFLHRRAALKLVSVPLLAGLGRLWLVAILARVLPPRAKSWIKGSRWWRR